MKGNFEKCLAITLKHEGGWSDHPSDPGGKTMKGVTLATYQAFRPGATASDLRKISDEELRAIYRKGYWDKVKGDSLPAGVDLVAFDTAVNSGPSRSVRLLQAVIGSKVDGVLGPRTLEAIKSTDPKAIIDQACDARLRFLRDLKTWPKFGKGWAARVADVRAQAHVMRLPVYDAIAPLTDNHGGFWAAFFAFILSPFMRKSQ